MKYREHAAFETNEFKSGDLVRIYDAMVVGNFRTDAVTVVKGDLIYTGAQSYHFKQCRKVEEIKPREWWIDTKPGVWTVWENIDSIDKVKGGFIRVREVEE